MSAEQEPDNFVMSCSINVTDDRKSATVTFTSSVSNWVAKVDVNAIQKVLETFSHARSQMLDQVSDPPSNDHPLSVFNPRWITVGDYKNAMAALWVRHPGFGWFGFGFPLNEATSLAKWFRNFATSFRRTTPSLTETSFGGDKFKLSTEGLRLYYYGSGDNYVGPEIFEQIEFDSDRAAAIVASAIVELRLEHLIKSRMRDDNAIRTKEIYRNLFRPSGPLGSFSAKIDMAYLHGLISDDACRDLVQIKEIRNRFAHDFNVQSFADQAIKSRCENLKIVERFSGPSTVIADLVSSINPKNQKLYLGFENHAENISNPRFRFVMTSQIISSVLGLGADDRTSEFPII